MLFFEEALMRYLTSSALVLVTAQAAFGSQAAELPFDRASFDSTVKAGQLVAVVFHADWCPTCRAQAPVLKQLVEQPKYKALTLFVANFDDESQLKRIAREQTKYHRGLSTRRRICAIYGRYAVRSPRCGALWSGGLKFRLTQ